MDLETPQWLNADLLKQSLQQADEYQNIVITRFITSQAVPAGNSFGSSVMRVNIEYKKENDNEITYSVSLIIKGPLTKGTISEIYGDPDNSEALFYNNFIPEAYNLCHNQFTPKSFISPLPSVVVLEDLKSQGYQMADKIKQLDFEHCQLYINAAASFHAVSFVLCKNNPELISTIGSQKLFSNNLKSANITQRMNKYALECLASHISDKKQSAIVRECATTLWDMLIETHKPSDSFNSFTQGDPWVNNMMFKYNINGQAHSIKLLDFQNVSYGSPIHDLVFFIWASVQHEVRRHRLKYLYCTYLEALNRNLNLLNCTETISYKTFMNEVHRMSSLALWIIGFAPCMLSSSNPDIESLYAVISQDEENILQNPHEQFFTESFCSTQLPKYLDELEVAGVFDFLASQQANL